jgi:biopolymer transport protein ExbB/TolQ
MYLTTLDMLAVMIALVVSVTLVITTALANARLTRSRDEWRKAYYDYQSWEDALNDAKEDRW